MLTTAPEVGADVPSSELREEGVEIGPAAPAPPESGGEPADRERGKITGGEIAPAGLSSAEMILADLARERTGERRLLRWAVAAAVVFHAVLLLVTFPEIVAKPREIERSGRIHLVPQLRFKPPPPPQGQRQVRKPKAKKIPIPDPTPDDPEPIVVPEVELPEVDLPEVDALVFGIPDAPPGNGLGMPGGEGPLQLGGNIKPPVKIFDLQPRYTEEARKARIQGIVILHSVVDVEGNVTRVKVIKGLPMGLTENAIEAVQQWKYKPATLDGEPVSVYYFIRVGFWMQ